MSQTEHKTQELCVHWTRNQLQNAFFKQGTLLLRGKPNSSEDPAMLCARWKLSATNLASHTPSRLLGQARRELFCTGKRDTIQDLYANFASPSREGPRKLPGSVGCAHHNSSTPLKKVSGLARPLGRHEARLTAAAKLNTQPSSPVSPAPPVPTFRTARVSRPPGADEAQ